MSIPVIIDIAVPDQVFNAIKQLVGHLAVKEFVVDFEAATWLALREVFPNIPIKGCAFHWAQAVFRKIQEVGLQAVYNQCGDAHNFLRQLMALPLLPAEHIRHIFYVMLFQTEDTKVREVMDYIERQWMLNRVFQTAELRGFLKSSGAEISGENAEAGLLVDLKNIIEASDICWKELTNDTDIEMVFNGVISLVLLLPPNEAESVVTLFCEKVGKAPPNDKKINIRLKMLCNLFHGVEAASPLRYVVYLSLVRLAGQADMLHMAPTNLDEIKVWIAKWDISSQKVQTLLRTLHNALVQAKAKDSTKVLIELLGTYTEDNASQAREDAQKCIVTCLADKNMFLMDHLLALKPVKFLEGELIHDLLTIFVSGRLTQYQQFYKNNTDFVTSFLGLSHEDNMAKMRVLTFMQSVENRTEIDFSSIQKEMQIEEDDVEEFIINVLRTKTVKASIDQMQKKVLINFTTHRTFGKPQWQLLRQKLAGWQNNLNSVQGSLQSLPATIAQQTPTA